MRVCTCLPLVLLLPLSQPPHSGNQPQTTTARTTPLWLSTQDSTASPTVNPVPSYAVPAAVTGFPGVLTYHNNNLRPGLNVRMRPSCLPRT
jgi:hypothetical protein